MAFNAQHQWIPLRYFSFHAIFHSGVMQNILIHQQLRVSSLSWRYFFILTKNCTGKQTLYKLFIFSEFSVYTHASLPFCYLNIHKFSSFLSTYFPLTLSYLNIIKNWPGFIHKFYRFFTIIFPTNVLFNVIYSSTFRYVYMFLSILKQHFSIIVMIKMELLKTEFMVWLNFYNIS